MYNIKTVSIIAEDTLGSVNDLIEWLCVSIKIGKVSIALYNYALLTSQWPIYLTTLMRLDSCNKNSSKILLKLKMTTRIV